VRAFVFDMDGLIVDSEPLWVRAEIEVFGEVGVTLSEDECALTKGLRSDDVVAFWYAERPWATPAPHEVQAKLVARVATLVREEGRALPGVARALATARDAACKVALASSSPSLVIGATLERLGLQAAFDVVQSAETEPLGKPHPGIFLRAAERLAVAPTDCIAIEDSLTGLVAAKAARMACIVVPCDYPAHDARFVLADAIVASLEDVTPELVSRLGMRSRSR
jgi:sugar-phosphatase